MPQKKDKLTDKPISSGPLTVNPPHQLLSTPPEKMLSPFSHQGSTKSNLNSGSSLSDLETSAIPAEIPAPPASQSATLPTPDQPSSGKNSPSPAPLKSAPALQIQAIDDSKYKLKKKSALFYFLLIILILLFTVFIFLLTRKQEFISPIPDNPKPILSLQSVPSKEIIGFLPFWNLNQEEYLRYHLLTQVAFFALQIDADGNIKKLKTDGTEEPGWTAYKNEKFSSVFRKAKNSGIKVTLTIQAMDSETISSIVNNQEHRIKTIQQTLDIIKQKNLDGVNVDFEYPGAPAFQTTKNFTLFIKEFRNAINQLNPQLVLSIDVFADAASKVRLWNLAEISESVDQIIVMAYDFHRPNSKIAAPVAPIRGSPTLWEYDIIRTLSDFSRSVPLHKIILGIPYYGYEWRTTSDKPYATTYPNTGSLATFQRIQSLINQQQPVLDWDEQALAPRLFYREKGSIHQIYYENETSLGIKYDLVNESGIEGIAIWALGYDGKYPNLWNLLSEKFHLNP